MSRIRVRIPATSANLGAGFDVFGLALDCLCDEVAMELTDGEGIEIESIEGYDLPLDPSRNCAAIAASAVFRLKSYSMGARMWIKKGIRPKSGLGSSAASSVGGALAASVLLGGLDEEDLIRCAGEGEKASSMSAHLDNVAPALFGGFTIVRSYDPIEVIRLETPENLGIVVVLPDAEASTLEARAVLPESAPVKSVVRNVGNASAFAAGVARKDIKLMGRAMDDAIFEKAREPLVPWLTNVRKAALNAGARGLALSGSGPSVIAVFDRTESDGEAVKRAVVEAFAERGMNSTGFVCSVGSGAEEVRC
jgi:homoserine kinase